MSLVVASEQAPGSAAHGDAAHGALTNALVTVVQGHHESNPSYPLTYR